MKRRHFLTLLAGVAAVRLAFAAKPDDPIAIKKLELSKDEWKKRLTPEQFAVLVDWRDDQISAIRDFLFAPYALESADWVRLR